MIRRMLPVLRDAAWHPGDEQLVAHIDAELDLRDAARIDDHLARCWTCRARRQQLHDTIGAFMQAYAGLVEEEEETAGAPMRMQRAAGHALRARVPHQPLSVLVERATRWLSGMLPTGLLPTGLLPTRLLPTRLLPTGLLPTRLLPTGLLPTRLLPTRPSSILLPARLLPPGMMPTRSVMVRLLAACATALLVFVMSSETQLSAVQLVRQADAAERALLDDARAPVIHQRLEVARRQLPGGPAIAGTWEVWTDVDLQRRHSQSLAPTAPTDDLARALFALFDRQGLRDAWPVSLRSHQQWRTREHDRGGGVQDAVERGRTASGESTVTLDTTLAPSTAASLPSGILRATLVVRERDWHPVEQRLLVRQDGATAEFVVREAHFEVVPLASLPVALFHETPAGGDAVADRVTPAPRVAAAVARDVDLVTAEVQAMYALHRVGLTAEDDISVTRREQRVEVRGVTTTEGRRKQLTSALARIPFVRTRIRTADEALAALAPTTAGSSPAPAPLQFDEAQIQADRLPTPGPNPAAAATADAVTMARARAAVTQALTLLERAWALRRLADWVNRTHASHITRTTRDLIDLMAREHADAASKALAALDATTAPALPARSASAPDAAPPAPPASPGGTASTQTWGEIATDFFAVAAEIDRNTRRLFTASAAPTTTAAEDAQRLRRGLDEAAQRLKDLQHTRP